MKTKIITSIALSLMAFCAHSQDLVSGGSNSWIFHTPDDGRTTMYVAPKTNGNWDWAKGTQFLNDGTVNFNGNITTGANFVHGGSNSWIFHTPDDGRTTMYIAPKTNGNWDWAKGTQFLNNGSVRFNGNIAVQGKLESKEIKVTTSPTADFVFEEDYRAPTLEEVEGYVRTHKHLPEIASAKEMETNGVDIGSFQIQLLQKIEELTLYVIEQHKQGKQQAAEIEALKAQIEKLKK